VSFINKRSATGEAEVATSRTRGCPKQYFFFTALQLLVGKGLLIVEDTRPHSDTHTHTHTHTHTVGLLWTSYQPDAETPHNTHKRHIHALGGIRTRNPSKRAARDPRLRPRVHWDRLPSQIHYLIVRSCLVVSTRNRLYANTREKRHIY